MAPQDVLTTDNTQPAFTADASQLASTPRIQEAEQEDQFSELRMLMGQYQPQVAGLERENNRLQTQQTAAIRQQGNQAQRFQELDQEFGISDARSDLAEIDEQIAQLEGEFNRAIVDEEGRTIAGRFVTGRQVQIARQAATAAKSLQAIRAAKDGKLALATQAAERALQLEFSDREAEIRALENDIQTNKEAIEKRTGKSEQELKLMLDERKRLLADEKDTRAEVLAIAQEAAANGADNQTLTLASQAATPEEALSIAGQFIGLQDRLNAQSSRASAAMNRRAALFEMAIGGDRSAIEQLGYDPANVNGGVEGAQMYEMQKGDIQMGIDAATEILGNDRGIALLTGQIQSPVLAGIGRSVGAGAAAGATAGTIVPGAGTVAGGIVGTAAGLAASPFAISRNRMAKDSAIGRINFLVNDTTFQEIIDLRASGVTFGNMTEGERIAAGRAAERLNAAVDVDESGKVTNYLGTPEELRTDVEALLKAYEGRLEYLAIEYGINPDEQSEAKDVWDSN